MPMTDDKPRAPDDWKEALGWNDALARDFAPYAAKGLLPARVSLVYRKQLKVLCHAGELMAGTGGRIRHHAASLGELPAVGDWVAARLPERDGEALVTAVLPRKSTFTRKVPGTSTAPQVLATNIDTALVVMGLDQDFNVRRVERFLTLAWEGGATPVVALNKKDTCAELDARLDAVRAVSRDARLHAVSALRGDGVDELSDVFGYGKTVAVLGSSGVGKSTLVNRVLGAPVMSTQGTREDGKGRHTTTHRQLFGLPGGGAIIDTPGLREVQLWGADDGVAKTFDDIEALAEQCRFGDCRHDAEPGCAVKAALDDGTLPQARYDSWVQLNKELDWLAQQGPKGRPETRRRERVGHGKRR